MVEWRRGRSDQSVSNLIVRPSFTSVGATPQSIQTNGLQTADDDGIKLGDVWRTLRRRRKLVLTTAGAVFALSLINTVYQRIANPVFAGAFTLLISDPLSDERRSTSEGSARFEQLARNTTSNDIPTLIQVLRSPLLLQPVAQQLSTSTNALASRITIRQGGGGGRNAAQGILNVSVTGRKPAETKRLLKTLSATYLQTAQEQRQQRLADGLNFLNQQAPELEARTSELQNELAQFRIRHSLLEPSEEGAALKTQGADLDQQLLALERERSRLQTVRNQIKNGSLSARGFQEAIGDDDSGGGGLSISDPDQALLEQLTQAENDLAEARSRFTPSSSMVTSLEARLSQLQPLLRREQLDAVELALNLNGDRLANTRKQRQNLNNQFLKQPELIKQFNDLKGRLSLAESNLAGLVSARETFQLEIAQSSVPWRVIAPPAVNPTPIEPSLGKSLLQGTLLALAAGIGAGLLRDRLDHVFHQAGDVKEELGLPLLGHIPHVEFFQGVREDKRFLLQELDRSVGSDGQGDDTADAQTRQQQRYQRFFYQEAFRNLFTSLRFLNSDSPVRAIALTSSLPAEGKSLVNVLLAKTLSEMGQRVLLVDADLRKPQMHTRLGLNNLSGLSNLLAEDDQHWSDVVQTVPGYANWSVITAGRRPPDPTRLLSSQRMHALVKELAQGTDFDLVLFDTPPVLGLADAALVAEHCDGLMLLVSLNRVDRGLPKEAVARIVSSGAPLLGVVTNAIKPEQQAGAYGYGKYGYGKYGYGKYGYGYGYGYAAYNSAEAYAHYVDGDDSETEESTTAAPPSHRWRHTLRTRRRQFMRWIDS